MSIKLVVFDIAGTTVEDPDGVGGCLKAALSAANVPWEHDEVNAIMGIPKPVAIRTLIEATGRVPDSEEVDAIFEDFLSRMIEYYRKDPSVKGIDGAKDVFAELREAGVRVALDTGFSRPVVNVLLKRLGWGEDTLDGTVTSDEVAQGRPFPDLVHNLMARFGITDPAEVAKVGDTPSDLQEGVAANCKLNIGVTYGTHTRQQLESFPHTHLVDSIRAIPSIVFEVS